MEQANDDGAFGRRHAARHLSRAAIVGAIYGTLAFAAGFVFGATRQLVLIPAFGTTAGILIEFPLMLIAVGLIARLLVGRTPDGAPAWAKVAVGVIGVVVLVTIESSFALVVLHRTMDQYLDSYDVTKGAVFPIGLLWMAVAPLAMGRGR